MAPTSSGFCRPTRDGRYLGTTGGGQAGRSRPTFVRSPRPPTSLGFFGVLAADGHVRARILRLVCFGAGAFYSRGCVIFRWRCGLSYYSPTPRGAHDGNTRPPVRRQAADQRRDRWRSGREPRRWRISRTRRTLCRHPRVPRHLPTAVARRGSHRARTTRGCRQARRLRLLRRTSSAGRRSTLAGRPVRASM